MCTRKNLCPAFLGLGLVAIAGLTACGGGGKGSGGAPAKLSSDALLTKGGFKQQKLTVEQLAEYTGYSCGTKSAHYCLASATTTPSDLASRLGEPARRSKGELEQGDRKLPTETLIYEVTDGLLRFRFAQVDDKTWKLIESGWSADVPPSAGK